MATKFINLVVDFSSYVAQLLKVTDENAVTTLILEVCENFSSGLIGRCEEAAMPFSQIVRKGLEKEIHELLVGINYTSVECSYKPELKIVMLTVELS